MLSRAQPANPVVFRPFSAARSCYHRRMFRFGRPSTPLQWLGPVVMASVALFLIWWMFRAFVL